VGDLSTAPVSISCQVCSPDIDCVQSSTLGKIEYHRVNITSQSVGLSLQNDKDNKVLSFVGKTNANIIFTFCRPTSKDR